MERDAAEPPSSLTRVPAGLPPLLAPLHRVRGRRAVPVTPPRCCRGLDRVDAAASFDARRALEGRLRWKLAVDFGRACACASRRVGCQRAARVGETALRASPPTGASYLAAARRGRPDRMFFERTLVMEGDTEPGWC